LGLVRQTPNGAFDSGFGGGFMDARLRWPSFYGRPTDSILFYPFDQPGVAVIHPEANGSIWLGGNFTGLGELPAYSWVELNWDGTGPDVVRLHGPIMQESGQLLLRIATPPGQRLAVERSTDLREWREVFSTAPATNRLEWIDTEVGLEKYQFYRVRQANE
jgi:hypothetical protein